MGIQNLLPHLLPSTREAHISEFESEFVAIDAYCWLHKGIYSCAYELAMKKPTEMYVNYCMRYIEMLLHYKVKPILVFDGRQLSSKRETEVKRREERKKKFERGRELMRAGNHQEGKKLLGESVDVTHEMALKLIEKCRKQNIDCIVAPYEADAQLAFLSIKNIVNCVITEDSDLLAYGSERVMFKMDLTGNGKLIEKKDIHLSLKMAPEEFSDDIFRYMCILSGCDYLPSLESIGPANALKFVKMLKGNNIFNVLPQLPSYLNKKKAFVTPEYITGFRIADNTFKHQLVYDPFLRMQVPVRPAKNEDDIIGEKLPDDVAFELALGNIDPMTMKKLSNYDPDKTGKGFSILWRTDSLPNATARQPSGSFGQMPGAGCRQREALESKTVKSATNDLNKQRIPFSLSSFKNSSTKNSVRKIPDCGFVFDVKVENKTASNRTDGSELLKSRYFFRAKDKTQEKKQVETTNDRRKDESDEEYLQRLYNEYFPSGENEDSETRKAGDVTAIETVLEGGCSLCGKDHSICTCCNENSDVSDNRTLGESIRNGEEISKGKGNSVQHFLLDEIYKSQVQKSEDLAKEDEREDEAKQGEVSPSQNLSLSFSKIFFKNTETPKSSLEDSKAGAVEKENAEVVCIEQESARPPSPVFKVRKGGKILKRNCGLGNVSDTAGTPTSVYFSINSERLHESNPQVSSKTTPFNRKMPSVRSFNSVPSKTGKSSFKSSSVNRTLFQFGFKKRRREESEPEA